MQPSRRFAGLAVSEILKVRQRAAAVEARGDRVAFLQVGQPDFDTPHAIKEASNAALARGETGYGPAAGLGSLRKALAEGMRASHGLHVDAGQVLVTHGASMAIYAALAAVLEEGDEVAILEPCWTNHAPMVRILGGVVRFIATRAEEDYQPTRAAIAAAITPRTRALIINAPNNPTGMNLTYAALEALADAARTHDLLVISDEVYDRIHFGAAPQSIATLPGMAERTAIVNAMSKTYAMTGWRIGYGIYPTVVAEAAILTHAYATTGVNTFIQYGALRALEACDADVERMRVSYLARRDQALAALAALAGVRTPVPDGGMFVFPAFGGFETSDDVLAQRLLDEAHVATVPGFAFGPNGRGKLRISFCAPEEELTRGLAAIAQWWARERS